jgi:hypothetical protein
VTADGAEFSSAIPDDLTTFGAAMRRFAPPIVDMIQERPYLEMQSLFDADYPPGRGYYNKAHILSRFGGGAIDATLRFAAPRHKPFKFRRWRPIFG